VDGESPQGPPLSGKTVGDLMVKDPKTLPPGASVGEVRSLFRNEHVHMVLLSTSGDLAGTLLREDLGDAPDDEPALPLSHLQGRTISPQAMADDAQRTLIAQEARRLAVVDDHGRLVGLLCLKRRRNGFCSDLDVKARDDAVPRAGASSRV
jgi:CBS domain-containing protein